MFSERQADKGALTINFVSSSLERPGPQESVNFIKSPESTLNFRLKKSKKKFLKVNKHIERLAKPRESYVPNDPFKYSDFKGLLNYEYPDALSNCFSQNQLNLINLKSGGKRNNLTLQNDSEYTTTRGERIETFTVPISQISPSVGDQK